MARFLRGQNEVCPTIPKRYFDAKSQAIMIDFRIRALSTRDPELLAAFPADLLAKELQNVWHRSARCLYRNWLSYMEAQRTGSSRPRPFGTSPPRAGPYPRPEFGS